jgi:nitrosocyanin
MKNSKKIFFVFFALLCLCASAFATERQFNITAVEINGTKFWFPSTLTVKKGDVVKIHAVSKVPGENSVHGFAIKDYNIAEVIDTKGKDIQFTADRDGIFPISCHLHPAHIGGQLVVLK